MTFKDQAAADLAVFYNTDEHADTVRYYPTEGVPVDIPAIIAYGQGESYKGAEGDTEGTARVQASDVPLPATGDEITIGEDRWRVVAVNPSEDSLEWILDISKYGD